MLNLCKYALGPLLLAQGARVRRVIPKLAEPAGDRAGACGEGARLRLLVVGDSAAAGVGVSHQEDALACKLARGLGRRYSVSWKLLARSGATTEDLLEMLRSAPAESFDVAFLSVGINDVTAGTSVRNWTASLHRVIEQLRTRFNVSCIVVSELPPIGRFPALPQPLRWYLGARAMAFNAQIRSLARADSSLLRLAQDFPLGVEAMATDGFHPGPVAYSAWSQAAAELILEARGAIDAAPAPERL